MLYRYASKDADNFADEEEQDAEHHQCVDSWAESNAERLNVGCIHEHSLIEQQDREFCWPDGSLVCNLHDIEPLCLVSFASGHGAQVFVRKAPYAVVPQTMFRRAHRSHDVQLRELLAQLYCFNDNMLPRIAPTVWRIEKT